MLSIDPWVSTKIRKGWMQKWNVCIRNYGLKALGCSAGLTIPNTWPSSNVKTFKKTPDWPVNYPIKDRERNLDFESLKNFSDFWFWLDVKLAWTQELTFQNLLDLRLIWVSWLATSCIMSAKFVLISKKGLVSILTADMSLTVTWYSKQIVAVESRMAQDAVHGKIVTKNISLQENTCAICLN